MGQAFLWDGHTTEERELWQSKISGWTRRALGEIEGAR